DADSLVNFFRQEGFFQAQVHPEVRLDTKHGLANVSFHTTLNKNAKFGTVEISGTTAEESEGLAKSLHSIGARARGASIRPGKTYHLSNINNATKHLQSRLEKQDRLAAKVQP